MFPDWGAACGSLEQHGWWSAGQKALERLEVVNDVTARIPFGRVGTTTDPAAAVLFLASPTARLMSGTSVVVN